MLARWIIVWLLVAGVKGVAANRADLPVDPQSPLADFLVEGWSTEDGLPQNAITDIAQTPDGYLWLSTFNGLARFDGARFVTFDVANTPEFKMSRFVRLDLDEEGGLWIYSETHEMTRFFKGAFKAFGREAGVPESGFAFTAVNRAGETWFGGSPSLEYYRFKDGRFVKVMDFPPPAPSRDNANLFASGPELFTYVNRELRRVDPPDFKVIPMPSRLRGAVKGRDGKMLGACASGVFRLEENLGWTKLGEFNPPIDDTIKLLEDRHNNIWGVTYAGGMWRIETNGIMRRFKLSKNERPESLRNIFEDREGNIWIASNGAGLYRLKPKIVRTLAPDDGLSGNVVKSVAQDAEGTIWAMAASTLNRIAADPPRVLETLQTTNANWVLRGDRTGNLWAGGWGGGVTRRKSDTAERVRMDGRNLAGICAALHVDEAGAIWAGGDFGLLRLKGLEAELIPLPQTNMAGTLIRAITQDASGQFFLGSSGSGLFIGQGTNWQQLRKKDGLPDDNVFALLGDKVGAVWMGFPGHGLARWKNGRLFHFSESNNWPVHSVYSIVEDDFENLWIGSNNGLFRVSLHELNELAEGSRRFLNVRRFGMTDGLPTSEFASGQHPTVCKARDGKLWFATLRGLAIVDPAAITLNTMPPSVIIEQALVNDQPVGIGGDRLVIAPGAQRIEFHYTGLSFVAPEKVLFRVKLEGLDEDWAPTGTRRSVYYSRVPPGSYRFRVIACNNDGVWNETGAAMAFTALPHYWQTGWFAGLAAASALGLGYLFVHRRVSHLKKERAAQQEFSNRLLEVQESERKRIARELHDSLGQSILLVKNGADLGRRQCGESERGEHFKNISEAASTALKEVRAIAYSLRPFELDCLGLSKAVGAMTERMAAASSIRFETDLDDVSGRLSPEAQIHLYRVIQESINNVVKHSGATKVIVELKAVENELRIVVHDNGKGFAADARTRGGMGLDGIAERVKLIGGEWNVRSAEGKGTRLSVTIPLQPPTGKQQRSAGFSPPHRLD